MLRRAGAIASVFVRVGILSQDESGWSHNLRIYTPLFFIYVCCMCSSCEIKFLSDLFPLAGGAFFSLPCRGNQSTCMYVYV